MASTAAAGGTTSTNRRRFVVLHIVTACLIVFESTRFLATACGAGLTVGAHPDAHAPATAAGRPHSVSMPMFAWARPWLVVVASVLLRVAFVGIGYHRLY